MNGGEAILTAAQMRAAEQAVIAGGVPEYELMERAGAAAAAIIWRAGGKRDLLLLCGPGNNGGDGFVIARILRAHGVRVRVAALGESRTASSLRARASWDGPVEAYADAAPATQIVDALFGTGLSRGLEAETAGKLRALTEQASFSYAIDLPSGVETDSGRLLSDVPRFGVSIALGALKPAHLLQPAAQFCGRVIRADIGLDISGKVQRLGAPQLAVPAASAHKYSRGLVVVVGGTMAGASRLACGAAARAGAGMVRLLTPEGSPAGFDAVVAQSAASGEALEAALRDERIGALLIGPGLGRDRAAATRLRAALESGRHLVLDADALNLLAAEGADPIPRQSVLTPHEGEFVRLFGNLAGSKIDRTLAAAQRCRSVVIFKGADTVIAAPDGRVAVAATGSPWLSTAGTGDVLAGLVAARFAMCGDGFQASCEAVWLHGEAARRAGAAFVADDLIVELPAVIASRL